MIFDPADGTMFVASFTLNHVVQLKTHTVERKKATYKVFVKGRYFQMSPCHDYILSCHRLTLLCDFDGAANLMAPWAWQS